jgi:hypothetical protein
MFVAALLRDHRNTGYKALDVLDNVFRSLVYPVPPVRFKEGNGGGIVLAQPDPEQKFALGLLHFPECPIRGQLHDGFQYCALFQHTGKPAPDLHLLADPIVLAVNLGPAGQQGSVREDIIEIVPFFLDEERPEGYSEFF